MNSLFQLFKDYLEDDAHQTRFLLENPIVALLPEILDYESWGQHLGGVNDLIVQKKIPPILQRISYVINIFVYLLKDFTNPIPKYCGESASIQKMICCFFMLST